MARGGGAKPAVAAARHPEDPQIRFCVPVADPPGPLRRAPLNRALQYIAMHHVCRSEIGPSHAVYVPCTRDVSFDGISVLSHA